MLNSPNRDGGSRATSHVEFFAKACTAMLEVVEKRAVQGQTNRERLQSIPYLHITLGTINNATFLLRKASETFIFQAAEQLDGCRPGQPRGSEPSKPDFTG